MQGCSGVRLLDSLGLSCPRKQVISGSSQEPRHVASPALVSSSAVGELLSSPSACELPLELGFLWVF